MARPAGASGPTDHDHRSAPHLPTELRPINPFFPPDRLATARRCRTARATTRNHRPRKRTPPSDRRTPRDVLGACAMSLLRRNRHAQSSASSIRSRRHPDPPASACTDLHHRTAGTPKQRQRCPRLEPACCRPATNFSTSSESPPDYAVWPQLPNAVIASPLALFQGLIERVGIVTGSWVDLSHYQTSSTRWLHPLRIKRPTCSTISAATRASRIETSNRRRRTYSPERVRGPPKKQEVRGVYCSASWSEVRPSSRVIGRDRSP